MTVLKHNTACLKTSSAVVLDLSDLGVQAKLLLANARTEAREIIEHAKIEAEKIRAQANIEGLKEGKSKGEQQGYEQGIKDARSEMMDSLKPQLETISESWNSALQQWEHERSDMLLSAREDVLTFAFDLASAVIGRTIELDPSLVQEQLKTALELLNQPTAITIVVHSDDEPLVQDVLDELLQTITSCKHANVVTDDSIARGGCIVRTAGGSVDATIKTQLTRLAEALLPKRSEENDQQLHSSA